MHFVVNVGVFVALPWQIWGDSCSGTANYFYRNMTTLRSGLCYRKSICRITFVRPTQKVETFGNISLSFCTLAILWSSAKFYGDRPRGIPFVGRYLCHVWVSHLLASFLVTVELLCFTNQWWGHRKIWGWTANCLRNHWCTSTYDDSTGTDSVVFSWLKMYSFSTVHLRIFLGTIPQASFLVGATVPTPKSTLWNPWLRHWLLKWMKWWPQVSVFSAFRFLSFFPALC